MVDVMIFAPSPLLTVTLDDDADGADLHVHAGGQGVRQARMLRTFGCTVSICAALTGETGRVVRHLLEDDGVEVHAVEHEGRDAGAASVVVSRADEATLLIDGDTVLAVRVPVMEEVDARGAGDSFTAALASALVEGQVLRDAVGLGVAGDGGRVTPDRLAARTEEVSGR